MLETKITVPETFATTVSILLFLFSSAASSILNVEWSLFEDY